MPEEGLSPSPVTPEDGVRILEPWVGMEREGAVDEDEAVAAGAAGAGAGAAPAAEAPGGAMDLKEDENMAGGGRRTGEGLL